MPTNPGTNKKITHLDQVTSLEPTDLIVVITNADTTKPAARTIQAENSIFNMNYRANGVDVAAAAGDLPIVFLTPFGDDIGGAYLVTYLEIVDANGKDIGNDGVADQSKTGFTVKNIGSAGAAYPAIVKYHAIIFR